MRSNELSTKVTEPVEVHFQLKYKEQLPSKRQIEQITADAVKFKYMYNGKELQDELGLNIYDYGARVYDPAAPRFWQVDPLAEKYSFQSVYVYADDNPVFFVDINGMGTEEQDWIPQVDDSGNVSYVAEEGDNAETFAKQFGLNEKVAKQIVPDNIKPGESVSGERVKAFTGSEVLKLDLNSKYADDNHFIYQLSFGFDYTKTHNLTEKTIDGNSVQGFYTTQFFKNVFDQSYSMKSINYKLGNTFVRFDIPLYNVNYSNFFHPKYRPYFLETNLNLIDDTHKGSMFGNFENLTKVNNGLYLNFGKGLIYQRYYQIIFPSSIKLKNVINDKVMKDIFNN